MCYGSLGTISHATLRTEDLLEAFADELEHLVQANGKTGMANQTAVDLINDAREVEDFDSEEASEIVQELSDALNEYAPPYCYFGANEGDGSDFGFWPCMEQIEELPRVECSDDAKELGEDCLFVNDHGNVTVYGGDGSIILELV